MSFDTNYLESFDGGRTQYNAGFISLGSENSGSFNDVSNYGWYDYKIWDDRPHHINEKGYFDLLWK
ncbi:hypothetical protein [Gaoshiqia sp. Z1-71]|uniref:hypothetical protein n=1 Tax=Gaoshiqia hydrogeniformans TaxID=3290090 RepID=UPI003BF7BE44